MSPDTKLSIAFILLLVVTSFLIRKFWKIINEIDKKNDGYLQKGIKDSYKAGIKS
jgi:hypothetical protein